MCGRSLAGIAGSNLTGGMDTCRECCVLSGIGVCVVPISRPEESYRGRACMCVCVSLSVIRCNSNNLVALHHIVNAYGPEIVGASSTSESNEQVVSPYSRPYLR